MSLLFHFTVDIHGQAALYDNISFEKIGIVIGLTYLLKPAVNWYCK